MESRASAEAEFVRRLFPLARRWRSIVDQTVANLGLSDATSWVLLHVGRLGDGVRQTELAAAVDVQGASLVRLLDQLERSSLVERRADGHDRRVNRIFLTGEGETTVVQMEQSLRAIRRDLFSGIDQADLTNANAMLSLLDQRVSARREKDR
jgi:MarR family transcriptional regulator, transcriptional regulator for hemolysin